VLDFASSFQKDTRHSRGSLDFGCGQEAKALAKTLFENSSEIPIYQIF
jgi:hypothetical protein